MFSIVWPSVLCSLQIFKPVDNKKTVVKGKLKPRSIISYMLYTLPLALGMGVCFFFFFFFFFLFNIYFYYMSCSLVSSNKVI